MSAEHIALPPIRELLLPDPGHVLFDADLSGADAQVVAWEANDHGLKQAFRDGLDIHNHNGHTIWGAAYTPQLVRRKLTWRDECKRSVHGTNYLSGVQGLARALGWTTAEVAQFQNLWFHTHPGIQQWHARVEHGVHTNRTVRNPFGYSITYFDRPTNVLPKAVAWIPQSTISRVCSRGAVRLRKSLPWCTVLLQVHDSVLFQLPYHRVSPSNLCSVRDTLSISIPYPNDPLLIQWGLKCSKENWQHLGPKLSWETLEPLEKAA